MAAVKFTCPHCETALKYANAIAVGAKVKCPKCGGTFAYTPEEEIAEFAEVAERDDDDENEADVERLATRARAKKNYHADTERLTRLISIGVVMLLLAAGAFAALVWPGFLQTPDFSEPLAFVPSDARLVLAVDLFGVGDQLGGQEDLDSAVGHLLSQATGGAIFPRQCKEKTGFDFRELFSHMTICIEENPGSDTRDTKGMIIFRSKGPYRKGSLLDFLGISASPSRLKGKSYFKKQERGVELSAYLPSNRILILCTDYQESDLERLFASDATKPGPTGEFMAMIDAVRSNPAWMAMPMSPANLGRLGAAGGAGLGPEIAPLMTTLLKAKSLGAFMTIEPSQVQFQIRANCPDAGIASQVTAEGQKLWDKYKPIAAAGVSAAVLANQIPKPLSNLLQELQQGLRFGTQSNVAVASTQVGIQTARAYFIEYMVKLWISGLPTPPGRPARRS
jgi:hypothetical protein